jgi:hypothetical protein
MVDARIAVASRWRRIEGQAQQSRVAVLLWEHQNEQRKCAWRSLTYIATHLKMHKSTVVRSLDFAVEIGSLSSGAADATAATNTGSALGRWTRMVGGRIVAHLAGLFSPR